MLISALAWARRACSSVLVGLRNAAVRVDLTISPRKRIASIGSRLEPIAPSTLWITSARSLCTAQALGLRGGVAARS